MRLDAVILASSLVFSTCTLTSNISRLSYSGVGLNLDMLLGNICLGRDSSSEPVTYFL